MSKDPDWYDEIKPKGRDPVESVIDNHDTHEARLEALNAFWESVDVAQEWQETPKSDDLPAWATIEEISDLMRLNRKTVTNAIKSGQIPAKKFGQQYRIHVPTITESFDQFREQSDADPREPKTRSSRRKGRKKRRKTSKKTTKKRVE